MTRTRDEQLAQLSREAATWRRRLRDAEGQLDAALHLIDQQRDALLRLLLAPKLADPDDLARHLGRAELLDLVLDDAGRIDPVALEAATSELLAWKPYLAASHPDDDAPPGRINTDGVAALREAHRPSRSAPAGHTPQASGRAWTPTRKGTP